MDRAGFNDLTAPGFRDIFLDNFGERPTEYTEIFNMETMSTQYVDDSYVTGFGNVPVKNEGTSITYDEALQGFDKRYTAVTRGLAYRITEEMIEDDRYRIMRKMPAQLGRSMRNTIEQDGANMLNNAFDGTNYADGGDGKELLALDHPLMGGGTQKNELTNAADFSYTSLEQATTDIAATTTDRGQLMNLMPKKLIVHPSKLWKAQKILKSSQEPGSANNDINPALNFVTVSANHYFTDPDAWFIICDMHEMNWFWRVKPDHQMGNDFDTGDAKFKVRGRWVRGWSLPWGVFGSPGA